MTSSAPDRTGEAATTTGRLDTRPALTLPELTDWVADDSVLLAGDQTPFRAHVQSGDPRLAVITGENASGKSLFARVLCAKAQQAKMTPVSVSIRERSGSGNHEMARMRQMMMFGDESEQSTGATSVKTTAAAFNNLDRDHGSLLLLDEPEMGLSDGYAAAFGRYIAQQTKTIPDSCAGVVVVSHNRPLVRALMDEYAATPTFIHLTAHAEIDGQEDHPATDELTLDAWLETPEVRSIDDLLALPQLGLERFRKVIRLLKD